MVSAPGVSESLGQVGTLVEFSPMARVSAAFLGSQTSTRASILETRKRFLFVKQQPLF